MMVRAGRTSKHSERSTYWVALTSLVVGLITFGVILWGIPNLERLIIATGFGVLCGGITYMLVSLMLYFYDKSTTVETQVEKAPARRAEKITASASMADPMMEPYSTTLTLIEESLDPISIRPAMHSLPSKPKKVPDKWSVELIDALEWRVFDRLTVAYWKAQGNGIVGVKMDAHRRNKFFVCAGEGKKHRLALVQSHGTHTESLRKVEMQKLLRQQQVSGVPTAVLMHVGHISNVIISFCESNNIRLINSKNIYHGLMALPQEVQQSLLSSLIDADYMTPTCPVCRHKMAQRKDLATGRMHWKCNSTPPCNTQVITG
ncbi:MAG: hypothetical protein AAF431_01405 [Pseudomonadota bacterium]